MDESDNPLLNDNFNIAIYNNSFIEEGDLTINSLRFLLHMWKEKYTFYKNSIVLITGSFNELFLELYKYLEIIKCQPIFFICLDNDGPHFLSGYFYGVDSAGKINLYLFDSLLNAAKDYRMLIKDELDNLSDDEHTPILIKNKISQLMMYINCFASCAGVCMVSKDTGWCLYPLDHELQKTGNGCSFFALKTIFKLIKNFDNINKFISYNIREGFFILPMELKYISQDINIIHGLIRELQEEPIYRSGLRRYPFAVRENKLLSPLARAKYDSEVRAHPRRNHTMLYFALKYYDTIYCATQASILRGPSYYEEEALVAPPAAAP